MGSWGGWLHRAALYLRSGNATPMWPTTDQSAWRAADHPMYELRSPPDSRDRQPSTPRRGGGMSQALVARQPLFDRRLEVVAYELLYRAPGEQVAHIVDADRATARVALNSLTELGLERVTGARPAWINVTREFLLDGRAAVLPPAHVVLEILENQLIDQQLVDTVRGLRDQGYRFALDDFEYSSDADPLLELAEYVKLDVLALGIDKVASEVARLRPYGVTLLAEKVETHEELALCMAAGCELFQGYFFCRPELLSTHSVDANRLSLLQLLAALQEPDIGLHALERIVALDLALGYRLLRYINSAFFGLRSEVRSIGQALALLGVEKLRQWAALSVFASVDRKPVELTITALVRARFCELVSPHQPCCSAAELFTLGLFSVVDALLDMPMADVVERVPFPEDTRRALVDHDGPQGRLIECMIALERGDLERAESLVPQAGDVYVEALEWADGAAEALFEPAAAAA